MFCIWINGILSSTKAKNYSFQGKMCGGMILPYFSEHVTTSTTYLSREVCTILQIKKISVSET